jgi:hypothetical protein
MIEMKNKKTIYALISIGIVIILIGSMVLYQVLNTKEEKETEEEEKFVLDDRISPLVNQGVVLEVLRIRHRGLLDELLKSGTSWKNEPVFYFISNIDNQEYISKDIEGAGDVTTEIPFIGWDTIFQENKIMRDAEEEQEKSSITLTLMEMKKSGIFGRKTNNVERDKFEITYDYRTGHWTGDDYLGDNDGYGHYLGETFEVWFNVYQIDFDGDQIPYWTEVNVYKTNPQIDDRYEDPDGDGIPTSWEWKYGYDPLTWDNHKQLDPDVDGIENIEEYKISKWFSDPFSPDIYIEVDGMESTGLFDPAHVLYKECMQAIIERFARHGLNVYFDDGWPGGPINGGGELVHHVETLSQDSGQFLQFYRNNFADERKGIFRYCLIGHNTGYSHPSYSNKVDSLTADSSLYKLYFKRFAFTPRLQRIVIASATMHELGHSLGIHSWTFKGCDKGGYEVPEYYSIMNYEYIFNKKLLDYSSGENGPENDQKDWDVLYLPHFQDIDVVIEGPYFTKLENREDYIIEKNPEPIIDGWEYDENLTELLSGKISELPTFYFDTYNYRAYVKTDEKQNQSDRDFRLYVKADIAPTHTLWVLVSEGKLKNDENIKFYSFEETIQSITE